MPIAPRSWTDGLVDMRMRGKVALVTGSTRGIGRAIAEMFAAEGAKVVVTGRTTELGREVASSIIESGGEALYVPTDIEKEADVKAAVAATVGEFGELTVLVNNAMTTELLMSGVDGTVTELTTKRWDRLMLGTLTGMFWACKYAIPKMTDAGGGSIVNISTIATTTAMAGIDAHAAGKAGMNALTRNIALEYSEQRIRSNAILTGLVDHGVSEGLAEESPLVSQLGPLHLTRLGRPDDIAYAATYLASEEAAFVTGTFLTVDGGLTGHLSFNVSQAVSEPAS
jgi:NAD(P)-dependent dehydrogenase (short-subunit alcohol dehydrogenase family)